MAREKSRLIEREDGPRDRVVVFGLGRFGMSLATTLAELGYEVIAIDRSDKLVADVADRVTLAAQGDGTDEQTLRSLGVEKCRYGIVTPGEDLEASILGTFVLKRLGIPWIVAKATDQLHAALLYRIGADRVVSPEVDAGADLAHTLSVRHVNNYIPLGPVSGVAKLAAPERFVGCTLGELCAPFVDHLDVLLIQRGQGLITHPTTNERVQAGDELLIVGSDPAIDAFANPESPHP
jgi:trk system potassium uptake protein TrkA